MLFTLQGTPQPTGRHNSPIAIPPTATSPGQTSPNLRSPRTQTPLRKGPGGSVGSPKPVPIMRLAAQTKGPGTPGR